MARSPRDLSVTLPSPSEMDNFHRCPCLWYLKDRLWIKTTAERWPLAFGRVIDTVCGLWLARDIKDLGAALMVFEAECELMQPETEDEDFETYKIGARDALKAWVEKYGAIAQRETIVAIQPKIKTNVNIKIDYIKETETGFRIVERKLVSGFTDIDDEMMKYEMGFQPICYDEKAREYPRLMGENIECVEMEFLIRSVPARGKFKAMPADARREEIYVESWKRDMWANSAVFTNACMQMLEESLALQPELAMEMIPKFTRNCILKFGKKNFPCDFYKACKTNVSPLLMPDDYRQDRREEAKPHGDGSESDSRSGGVCAGPEQAPSSGDGVRDQGSEGASA